MYLTTIVFMFACLLITVLAGWPALIMVSFVGTGPITVALILASIYRYFRIKLCEYTITSKEISIHQRFIPKSRKTVPIKNVVDIAVKSSLFQRAFSLETLVITPKYAKDRLTLEAIPQVKQIRSKIIATKSGEEGT